MIRWILNLLRSPKTLIAFGVTALIILIGVIAAFNGAVGWNNQGEMRTGIYLTGGTYFVKTPGYYFRWFAQQEEKWPYVATLSIGSYEGKGDDIKDSDVPRMKVSFAGAAKADQSALFRFDMPKTKEEMFKIWEKYPGAYPMFIRKGLLPEAQTALRTAANLIEPEEALNNISQFRDKVADQMQNGLLMTYTEMRDITNSAGEQERKQITKEKTDEDGNLLREPLRFGALGVSFSQVEVSLPVFEKDVNDAIMERRRQTLNAETAKKRRIAAEQDLLAQKAEGEAAVVQAQFRIQKEQAEVVASARLALEKSELDVQAAENEKKAAILRAEGDAKAKQLVMHADGYMEKILKAEITKTELIADAIKNSNVRWVPDVAIYADGSGDKGRGGSDQIRSLVDFATIEAAKKLRDDVKETGKRAVK